jgi:hypothetical protein
LYDKAGWESIGPLLDYSIFIDADAGCSSFSGRSLPGYDGNEADLESFRRLDNER